jgi:hypothetical protein
MPPTTGSGALNHFDAHDPELSGQPSAALNRAPAMLENGKRARSQTGVVAARKWMLPLAPLAIRKWDRRRHHSSRPVPPPAQPKRISALAGVLRLPSIRFPRSRTPLPRARTGCMNRCQYSERTRPTRPGGGRASQDRQGRVSGFRPSAEDRRRNVLQVAIVPHAQHGIVGAEPRCLARRRGRPERPAPRRAPDTSEGAGTPVNQMGPRDGIFRPPIQIHTSGKGPIGTRRAPRQRVIGNGPENYSKQVPSPRRADGRCRGRRFTRAVDAVGTPEQVDTMIADTVQVISARTPCRSPGMA